jgi:hypothetical protein
VHFEATDVLAGEVINPNELDFPERRRSQLVHLPGHERVRRYMTCMVVRGMDDTQTHQSAQGDLLKPGKIKELQRRRKGGEERLKKLGRETGAGREGQSYEVSEWRK